MKEVLMMKGARTVIDLCANAKKGEKVLVVTDPERASIAKVLMAALYERSIDAVMCVMPPNEFDGQEPPKIVAGALLEADVVLMPVSRSISHSTAVKAALKNGARIIALSAFEEEQMYTGGILADFAKEKIVCDRFSDYFDKGNIVTITTPAGTNYTASIAGRPGNSHSGIVTKPGAYTAVPNIEANVSPVEGTSEGVLVIDGSVPNFGIGVVETPVVYKMKDGVIYEISGGKEAARLNSLSQSMNDPAVYNIAQIAIGLNPECKRVNGQMLNDHGAYGRVHIGIGTSSSLGGKVKAPLHYDVVMEKPTMIIDGKVVLKDGIPVG
jgi:leucyl aminopeptidase (aminopeptidase T)